MSGRYRHPRQPVGVGISYSLATHNRWQKGVLFVLLLIIFNLSCFNCFYLSKKFPTNESAEIGVFDLCSTSREELCLTVPLENVESINLFRMHTNAPDRSSVYSTFPFTSIQLLYRKKYRFFRTNNSRNNRKVTNLNKHIGFTWHFILLIQWL